MRPVPAVVQRATETPTAFGGRGVAWTVAAVVWVELRRSDPVTQTQADAPPERREGAEARARAHPALLAGVRLDTGDGPPWTVIDVRPDTPAPGRTTLLLDRLL